jgi:hypothetical protein
MFTAPPIRSPETPRADRSPAAPMACEVPAAGHGPREHRLIHLHVTSYIIHVFYLIYARVYIGSDPVGYSATESHIPSAFATLHLER